MSRSDRIPMYSKSNNQAMSYAELEVAAKVAGGTSDIRALPIVQLLLRESTWVL